MVVEPVFGIVPYCLFLLAVSFFFSRSGLVCLVESGNNLVGYVVCFVGIQDGKIVSAALLQDPKGKRVSVGDYTKAGAVSLVFPVGFAKILDFFDISEKPIRIVRWST